MEEVLRANIFFLITGIAVIVCAALLCVVLYHTVRALRTLRRILDRIEEGTEVIAEDMQNVRAYFAEEGFLPRLLNTLMGRSGKKRAERKTHKHDKKRGDLKLREEQ